MSDADHIKALRRMPGTMAGKLRDYRDPFEPDPPKQDPAPAPANQTFFGRTVADWIKTVVPQS